VQAVRLASVVIVGIIAVAMASCGGDDDDGGMSTDDFAEQTKAICRQANKEEAALDPPDPGAREGNKYDDSDFQAEFNAIGHRALRKLKALPPPQENPAKFEEVLDSIDRLLSARDERIAAMRKANTQRQAAAIREIDTAYFDLASSAGSLTLAECQGVGF
jgi:hypothetical protein